MQTAARSSSIPNKDNCQGVSIFLKKWFRTEKAVVMYLTDGTLQVVCVIFKFLSSNQDLMQVWLFLLVSRSTNK